MKNPRKIIADVARRYVGVHEQSENWSPQIAKFWEATSIPDGAAQRYPWCAAFVCFVIKTADRESEAIKLPAPPRMPNVNGWVPWAKRNGAMVFGPSDCVPRLDVGRLWFRQPIAGDVVEFLPRLSHIGIVIDFDPERKRVSTIEGNTNAEGGREGVEVAVKYRALDFCGHFIRVPVVVPDSEAEA